MRRNGLRTFSQGVDLRGPLALSVTQREGGAKPPRRPRQLLHSAATGPPLESLEDGNDDAEVSDILMERTLQLVALLRYAEEVKAPKGVPCEGKVVSFDNTLAFLRRYRKFVKQLGSELALPQVTFHWTAEENFQSIVESNLKVPNADSSGVKKKHGAAFGRGIYTAPDYKMAKEDFSYGASTTFACLAITGRQMTRQHGKGHGLSDCRGADFESVVGRLPGRNCVTWVLPSSDQILPCFLVDEVAIPAAVAKLREAILLIREPWPEAPSPAPSELAGMEGLDTDERVPDCPQDSMGSRWRRADRGYSAAAACPDREDETDAKEDGNSNEVPYGGDLQAAMRAQDRSAIKLLMALRDAKATSQATAKGGRRWGARNEAPRSVGLVQKCGDLLQASEDFIVHQCNCVYSGAAQGIAEAIFNAFPAADAYRSRAEQGRPHDIPGTISVHGRIVNVYGQLLPGRPVDDAPSGGWSGTGRFVTAAKAAEDTRSNRLKWFEQCLDALPKNLPSRCSVAFPARIGCGLAGGDWSRYLAALKRFSEACPNWQVAIYDIESCQPEPPAKPMTPLIRDVKPKDRGSAGQLPSSAFWSNAVFEVLRGGEWVAYSKALQAELRSALQREDDCREIMVDNERRQALSMLAEVGACPRSLGGGVESKALGLRVHLDGDSGPEEVDLAPLVRAADHGESDGACGKSAVRLWLPAVREGELRLPADLDIGASPTPRECGCVAEPPQSDACGICLGELKRRPMAVLRLHCGHFFHEACLERWFEERRRCPSCKRRFGHLVGNQPSIGTMSWRLDSRVRLSGHPDSFTIVMSFRFPAGRDANGESYVGRTQQAFLPHDEKGKLLLALFQLGFRRRVLFDLRVSATENKYWPAFNIHLKTAVSGGPERFGFPDDGYGQRVLEELRENGVTIAEL
ncbi:unnamed protein product [Effrenium voratum]|uniref:RING-type E3 ubiquitin transferase n=1 Tax=Effrenium voratum TaxID=2562239 RepID=A0AA36NER6_9DINO|nr:unnamed protein product [Effrenium voratum]